MEEWTCPKESDPNSYLHHPRHNNHFQSQKMDCCCRQYMTGGALCPPLACTTVHGAQQPLWDMQAGRLWRDQYALQEVANEGDKRKRLEDEMGKMTSKLWRQGWEEVGRNVCPAPALMTTRLWISMCRANGKMSDTLYASHHKDLIEVIQGDQSKANRLLLAVLSEWLGRSYLSSERVCG